jgi:hypothetical protein
MQIPTFGSLHHLSSFGLTDPTKPGHRRLIALRLIDPLQKIISIANVPPQQPDWALDSLIGTSPQSRKAALSKVPTEVMILMQQDKLYQEIANAAGQGVLAAELMQYSGLSRRSRGAGRKAE